MKNPFDKRVPRTAKTFKQTCELETDSFDADKFWGIMVCEDGVYISKQKGGEMPSSEVYIPRKQFDKIIDWYNGVITNPKRKAAK